MYYSRLRDADYISTDVLRIAVVLNASVYFTAYAIALSYTRIYPGLLTIPFLPTLRHIAKYMGCSIAKTGAQRNRYSGIAAA